MIGFTSNNSRKLWPSLCLKEEKPFLQRFCVKRFVDGFLACFYRNFFCLQLLLYFAVFSKVIADSMSLALAYKGVRGCLGAAAEFFAAK